MKDSRDLIQKVQNRQAIAPGVSRVEHAYRLILALITDGALEGGDRLPSETEMASSFGVSRPVVREALTRLQQGGILEIRWGAGSYVLDPENHGPLEANFGPLESVDEIRHSFEIRIALEEKAAELAALRGSKATSKKIRLAFDKMESAINTQELAVDADWHFHVAIAEASQNPFFVRAHQSFRNPITFSMSLARSLSLTHPKERLQTVQQEHIAILQAIEQKKPDDASSAMRLHLENSCSRIFEGPPSAFGAGRAHSRKKKVIAKDMVFAKRMTKAE
jgi:GntR family transcriptional regulator, transcriptional repressor for pyruvate dehydrogenase complex